MSNLTATMSNLTDANVTGGPVCPELRDLMSQLGSGKTDDPKVILQAILDQGSAFPWLPVTPPIASTAIQLVIQLFLYLYLLYIAADLIGAGSELLLLVPSLANITGSIIIPCLGAVPDVALGRVRFWWTTTRSAVEHS